MRILLAITATLCLAAPVAADRDFLTTDEADQVRLTQEPNARLKLYVDFTRQRVEMLEDLLAKKKSGRSSLIHETIEDYTKLIETMDVVTDDALEREVDLTEGVTAVAEAEDEFLKRLKKVVASAPADLPRYRFVLDMAIETTEDSLQLAKEDLGARKLEVAGKEKREQKKLESMMTPEMAKQRKADTARIKKEQKEKEKKKPSLLKKGEKKP